MDLFNFLHIWSEVWALLIPLIIIILFKPKGKNVKLLIWYVLIGLLMNFAANFMLQYHNVIPSWMYINNMVNNNLPYNIHSIIRVLFFSLYFINIRQYKYPILLKVLLLGYIIFVIIDFSFFESIFFLSTSIYTAESIVLLTICITYFLRSIMEESKANWINHPSFLVCTGISLYEAATFFIFLFFYPLSKKEPSFFLLTMKIYSIVFILFCILLAVALYRYRKNKQIDTS